MPKLVQRKARPFRRGRLGEQLQTEHKGFDGFHPEHGHRVARTGDLLGQPAGGGVDHLQQPRRQGRIAGDDLGDGFHAGIRRLSLLDDFEIGGGQAGKLSQPRNKRTQGVAGKPGIQGEASFENGNQVRRFPRPGNELMGRAHAVDNEFPVPHVPQRKAQGPGMLEGGLLQKFRVVHAARAQVGDHDVEGRLRQHGQRRGGIR